MKSIILIMLFFLVGCVTAPTSEQLRNADYGTYPFNHEETIKNYMALRLKDPTSAIYTFGRQPRSMWAGGGLSGPIQYGYGACAHINAKNSFGGYTGAKEYFFLIKNDQIIKEQEVGFLSNNPCR